MTIQDVYNSADLLNEKLKEIERIVKRFPVKKDGLRLSTERHSDKIQLCFDGKPLAESSMAARIEAVKTLGLFFQAFHEAKTVRKAEVEEALRSASQWLELLQAEETDCAPRDADTTADEAEDIDPELFRKWEKFLNAGRDL